jgi:alkanesulfonate monooxygenase SsuD/methylene tetrahydromethanopterin reductase-like flavin-dependent oxidoreductase (luciferase family)
VARSATGKIDFSLFYFASDEARTHADKYRLLLEGARFADRTASAAVWTPERHFHAFGGLYPNPRSPARPSRPSPRTCRSAPAACVLPLHHPLRVAEEWAWSTTSPRGRVGIAFAVRLAAQRLRARPRTTPTARTSC